MSDPGAAARTIITGINDRDWVTVIEHLDPAYEATWPHGTLDLAAAGAHEQAMLTAFPDLRFEFVNTVVEGNTVVLEVLACGTHDGVLDLPGEAPVQPKGAELRLPMTLVLVFDGGRLRTERLYFDQLTMLRQVDGRGAWASNAVSG
jgi:predicted ester cyclase